MSDSFLDILGDDEAIEKLATDIWNEISQDGTLDKEAFMPMPGGQDPMAGGMPPPGGDPMAGGMPPPPPMGGDPMAGGMMPPPPMGGDPMAGGMPPPGGGELDMIKPIIADVVKEVLTEMGVTGGQGAAGEAPKDTGEAKISLSDVMSKLDSISDRLDRVEAPGALPEGVEEAASLGQVGDAGVPPMSESEIMGQIGDGGYDFTEKPAAQTLARGLSLIDKINKLRTGC